MRQLYKIFLLFTLPYLLGIISCEKSKFTTFVNDVSIAAYKLIKEDSLGNRSFDFANDDRITYSLDSLYWQIAFNFVFARQSRNIFIDNAFAFRKSYPVHRMDSKIKSINFYTVNKINDNYPSNSNINDLIQFEKYTGLDNFINSFNENSYEKLTIDNQNNYTIKFALSDTVLLEIKAIIEFDNESYIHTTSKSIKVY